MLSAQIISLGQAEVGKEVTIEGELEALNEMRTRLQAAVQGGWADYPVLPASDVTTPTKTAVYLTYLGKQETYPIVAWPQEEYRRWQWAWKYLAEDVLQHLGKAKAFPLGDAEKFGAWYQLVSKPDPSWAGADQLAAFENIKKLPTVIDAMMAITGLMNAVKRKLAPPKKKKEKPLITATMIIGAIAAVAVGGVLYYYYRRGGLPKSTKLPPVPPSKPLPEPYPTPEPESYATGPIPGPPVPGRRPSIDLPPLYPGV